MARDFDRKVADIQVRVAALNRHTFLLDLSHRPRHDTVWQTITKLKPRCVEDE
ncbi:hypothetical protein GGQ68_001031 [Sagittula marina]|uniref:Uncharacterized protein n=1 Tax=Sagittula marina TaxID=943940 RepID=A0A7W6DK54_9RHOB|nr:hypothetical protein [Sagittula marina]